MIKEYDSKKISTNRSPFYIFFSYNFCRSLKTSHQYFRERTRTKDFSHPPSLVTITDLRTRERARAGHTATLDNYTSEGGWWSRYHAGHHTSDGRANVGKGTGHTTTLGLCAMVRAGRRAMPLPCIVMGERRASGFAQSTSERREEKTRKEKELY